jgi:hypothetical protein
MYTPNLAGHAPKCSRAACSHHEEAHYQNEEVARPQSGLLRSYLLFGRVSGMGRDPVLGCGADYVVEARAHKVSRLRKMVFQAIA